MAANIFAEILSWSKQLAPWQNEVIRRLFAKGGLSVSDKDEIFQLAQIEHGLQAVPSKPPDLMLKATDLPTPPTAGERIILKAVREPVNVNALRADQRLVIGDQLTIIYGENASGKSGYARIMKKAFRARAIDPVLPNVYVTTPSKGPASAIFEVEESRVVRDEKWTDGVKPPECLGRFAVFDAKCARVYITDDNQLTFLPYGFDIIDGLGAMTNEVKRRFQELGIRSAPNPNSLSPLVDNTSIGKLIGSLTSSSKENDIRSKAIWDEESARVFKDKELELAQFKANSPQTIRDALNARKRQLEAIRAALDSVAQAISDTKIEEIKTKLSSLAKYEQAVAAAAKAAFGDLDLPGIGSEVWRELLRAAAAYSTQEAYPEQPFPATESGAKCVLCLQPLSEPAQERLKRFWDFILDDTSSKRDKANEELEVEEKALRQLPRQLPTEIQILEDTLRSSGSTIFEEAEAFYASAAKRIAAMESAIASSSWEQIPPEQKSPAHSCDVEISLLDRRLAEVVDDKKVSESIKWLTTEIAELSARRRLHENMSLVLDYVKALKASAMANAAASKITTNAISLKANDLQTRFVTEEFKRRIREELKPLDLVRVRAGIDKKSEKGKVLHKVTVEGVPSAPPEAVFSEGERTAISLACFLAELGATEDNCGIIFDDPVSSFDHRIRRAVVNRLVPEAASRQVIIFTHDLVFYRELVRAAERREISATFQNVEALGDTVGILTEIPWHMLRVGQRVAKLEEILKKVKDAEKAAFPAAYRSAFREFYDLLRSTWERSVEELLFNQVVQRLELEVKTMSLDGVYVDSESVEAVFDGMKRTSEMIAAHDHADAQNMPLPAAGEVARDLEAFKAFVERQKAKIKTAEKQNAHLKR